MNETLNKSIDILNKIADIALGILAGLIAPLSPEIAMEITQV